MPSWVPVIRATFLLAVALLACAVRAQEPAALCTCDPTADRFEIRYTPNDEKWPKEPKPIHLMSLLDIDDDGVHTSVRGIRSTTLRCRLKHDRFEVKLAPGVPNRNLQGHCGMAITAVVTVKRNGIVVVDGKWLENADCFERDRTIDCITFRDGIAEPDVHESR